MVDIQSHTFKLATMLVLVFIYFVIELVVGHILNSLTLIADSFHMLSDFIALIIGITARRISRWPKSSKNTFGWQRAEVLGTLLNTVMLITLTFTILIEIVQKYVQPELVEQPKVLLIVGTGGLLVNIIGLIILGGNHGHSHDAEAPIEVIMEDLENEKLVENNKSVDVVIDVRTNNRRSKHGHSHKARNMNLQAVFLHILADFFGSVAVVVSAAIIWLVPNPISKVISNSTVPNVTFCPNVTIANVPITWKAYVDPSISLIMVILILVSTAPLAKKSAMILLQSVPKDVSISNLKRRMEEIEGIVKVHDLHVWQLQSDVIIGTVHIRCSNEQYVTVSKKAKKLFHDFNIHCTTIQAEFDEHLSDDGYDDCDGGGGVSRREKGRGSDGDRCVLFCGDSSVSKGSNVCKAKEFCCPTKSAPNVVVTDSAETSTVAVPHQLSAPCLRTLAGNRKHNSETQLDDISERP